MLALQNPKLVSSLNHVPGLPVIHYNARGVMVLAPPGQATVRAKNALEDGRRRAGADLLDGVVDGENVVGAASTSVASSTDVVRTRKVKAKGPNPLSMRKKKAPAPTPAAGGKRKLDDDNDNDDDKEDAPAPGDEDEESRKKKKRKRGRGKGVVAAAIAEIKAGGLGGVITHKEDPPSGDESD